MRAGSLSERILFQAPQGTSPISIYVVWVDDFTVPAEVEQTGEQTARFTIRYKAGISPSSHRIVWDEKLWRIVNAIHDRKRKQLVIDCDIGAWVDVTDLDSDTTEYIGNVPVVEPPSE